jgi:dephospho-CoA kinase
MTRNRKKNEHAEMRPGLVPQSGTSASSASGGAPIGGPAVLGIVGGIGSGKSTVAREFERLGWYVIDSDAEVRCVLRRPDVARTLAQWWGTRVLDADGTVDRSAVGRIVFADESARKRLEGLVHPLVTRTRAEAIARAAAAAGVPPVGVIYDAPLLFEAGLDRECDAVAFVEASAAVREERLRLSRGWGREEIAKREAAQWPLERKKALSRFVIQNDGTPLDLAEQCRRIAAILTGDQG